MNKRRLLKLADLLEADAKNKKGIKFDMDVVACHSKPVRDGLSSIRARMFVEGDAPTLDCGTAACAVGLAALSGAFKRQGFSYVITPRFGFEPTFGQHRGFGDADAVFFHLSSEEQNFLFHPSQYEGSVIGARGERLVAKRIRDFVAGTVGPTL